ncbi:hypothetical protein QJQ45_013085 [Haematococcus lacustris]|nr:hypothetical protein QJQ45_013085 [Haematococcus lacustris]
MASIAQEVAKELRSSIWGGEVLLPGDPAFEQACKTWAMPTVSTVPAVVVRPRGTMDVQAAIKAARAHGLQVAVKGGGHSAVQLGLVQEGMTIDLSLMRSVAVDPVNKVAIADGGCLLGDIDRETALHGLAVPLGHAPVTGMGLALGGGFGIATRVLGTTSDHIVGATIRVVDKDSDPELLWCLRGAASAMGVVTKIKFRLDDVSDAVTGTMVFPDDPEHTMWRRLVEFVRDQGYHEPGFSTPVARAVQPNGTALITLMVFYLSPKSREERLAFLQPLRDLNPIVDTVGKARYLDTQFTFDGPLRSFPPHYEYGGEAYINDLTRVLLDELPYHKLPLTLALFDAYGGVMKNQDGPTPFAIGYLDPSLHEEVQEFAAKAKKVLSAYGELDVYSNVAGASAASDEKLAARLGGAANLVRVRAMKLKLDPDNVFNRHPLQGLWAA